MHLLVPIRAELVFLLQSGARSPFLIRSNHAAGAREKEFISSSSKTIFRPKGNEYEKAFNRFGCDDHFCPSSIHGVPRAADPFTGTWRLDPSKTEDSNPYQITLASITNGISLQTNQQAPFVAYYNGKDYPIGHRQHH